jgi:uncharacterized protein
MSTQPSENAEQLVPVILSRAWHRHSGPALEYFNLQSAQGMLFFSGQITSVIDGVPCMVNYGVACDRNWVTREAHVHMTLGGAASSASLARAEGGLWRVNDEEREDLDGAVDLDIQWTPSTNALPVNRLQLQVGESREVAAAWVQIPSLTVERLPQRYTRLQENVYQYESGGGRFVAELAVDEAGFVERYGDIWVCIGKA